MEKFAMLLIPLLLAVLMFRLFLTPMSQIVRLGMHAGCGLLCLWMLNSVSVFTGIFFPINAVSVLVAGFGGLPGMGILALLTVINP